MMGGGPAERPVPGRLAVADAYRLWSGRYERETAISALEDRVVRGVMPRLGGRRLLDVGCGTGRRLPGPGKEPSLAVGIDLAPEMLLVGRRSGSVGLLASGDVRRLPVATSAFDVVWCRLVLGHLSELSVAYDELTRVSRPGTDLIVTDFHPAAVAAGHTRTFRDSTGEVREIEHWVHQPEDHVAAARERGWAHVSTLDAVPGGPERRYYERAGRLHQLEAEADLPLVLVLCFRK